MIDWRSEWRPLAWMAAAFAVLYWLPVGSPRFDGAVTEALALTRWYAREHVLLCLVPAFFIAGAIASFVSQAAVMKYLGPKAPKVVAYGVASVSGTILAVCSCTVLPLFAGIHQMGAGLGPATAFLYSGPAINVLAVVLTASVLGAKLGAARAIGAVLFALVVGASWPSSSDARSRPGWTPPWRCPSPTGETARPGRGLLRRPGRDPGLRQLGAPEDPTGLVRDLAPSGG